MSPDGSARRDEGILPGFEANDRTALIPSLCGDQAFVDTESPECTISFAPRRDDGAVVDPQHPNPVLRFRGRRGLGGRHVGRIARKAGTEVGS